MRFIFLREDKDGGFYSCEKGYIRVSYKNYLGLFRMLTHELWHFFFYKTNNPRVYMLVHRIPWVGY